MTIAILVCLCAHPLKYFFFSLSHSLSLVLDRHGKSFCKLLNSLRKIKTMSKGKNRKQRPKQTMLFASLYIDQLAYPLILAYIPTFCYCHYLVLVLFILIFARFFDSYLACSEKKKITQAQCNSTKIIINFIFVVCNFEL